jgi:putative transcriptional regulator
VRWNNVPVSYNKLWKILIDKRMNRTDLKDAAGIGTTTLSKLGKDQFVSMEVLVKICDTLDCNIGDIVDYIKEEKSD